MNNIHYASIRNLDISNGEGIGVALFVQGCHFHCYNCFNTETWDFNGGKEWTPEVKEKFLELIDKPYIKRVSILGGEPLADENLDDVLDLVTEINKRYNFQKVDSANPCKMGVSEVENPNEIRLSLPNKTIWLYTGYEVNLESYEILTIGKEYAKTRYEFTTTQPSRSNTANFLRKSILNNVDVLVDGRYIDSQRDVNLKWRGSKNQRVIDIKQSLQKGKVTLWTE